MTEKFEATLLTEEAPYTINEEVAESFEGLHIYKNSRMERTHNVVGLVDSCFVRGGKLIAEITIYNQDYSHKLSNGDAAICPTIERDFTGDDTIEGVSTFMTNSPGDVVGEVKKL